MRENYCMPLEYLKNIAVEEEKEEEKGVITEG